MSDNPHRAAGAPVKATNDITIEASIAAAGNQKLTTGRKARPSTPRKRTPAKSPAAADW